MNAIEFQLKGARYSKIQEEIGIIEGHKLIPLQIRQGYNSH